MFNIARKIDQALRVLLVARKPHCILGSGRADAIDLRECSRIRHLARTGNSSKQS